MLLRLAAIQAGAMGLLGLLLAVVGVYGVTSYGAAQRTHEVGIRVALGAASRDVLALALRQGLLVVAGGIVVGLAGAVATTRVLANVLGMQRAGEHWCSPR
jgi:putative ABC transport system permease protein